ncbi:MAG: lytic transglycosylase domain-containing protein [Anaerolineales bacterium]
MEYSPNNTPFHVNRVFMGLLLFVIFVGWAGYTLSSVFITPQSSFFADSAITEMERQENRIASVSDSVKNGSSITCMVSESYPKSIRRWCELITRAAQKNHLDADLLAALIWVESGGNPSVVSVSGAIGLMQIMPRDGNAAGFQCVSGPCFANRPSTDQLLDPQFNLQYGARMLAGLIKKNGSLREALRAYGPMDVGYTYADKVLAIYRKYQSDGR